jgi:hypothetical protein
MPDIYSLLPRYPQYPKQTKYAKGVQYCCWPELHEQKDHLFQFVMSPRRALQPFDECAHVVVAQAQGAVLLAILKQSADR